MKSHYFLLVLFAWVMQAQAELPGFPISYARSSSAVDILRERGPVVANVDNDTEFELIVLTDTSPTDGKSNRVLIFDPLTPNTPEYIFDMPTDLVTGGYAFGHSPAVLDGNGDGVMEIAVAAENGAELTNNCPWGTNECSHDQICYHPFSELLVFEIGNAVPYRVHLTATKLTQPAVGDVTGDGLDDIVFVGRAPDGFTAQTGNPNWGNDIKVFSWNFEQSTFSLANSHGFGVCSPTGFIESKCIHESTVSLGDLNNDGVSEIVALLPDADTDLGEAELIIIQYFPTQSVNEITLGGKFVLDDIGDGGYSGPILGDIIEDGILDAAFIVLDEDNDQATQQLAIYDGATEIVTFVFIPTGFQFSPKDMLAIADGPSTSDRLDIYIPTRSATQLRMQWLRWNVNDPVFANDFLDWPKSFDQNEAWEGAGYAPAIVSTNVSGALELVSQFGVGPTNNIWKLKLNNADGADAAISVGNDFEGSNPYLGVPTVEDLDGDGEVELVVTAGAADGSGRIHAYELNIAPNPRRTEWNGLLNGPKHTGLYAQPVAGIQSPLNARWSGRIIVHETYEVWDNMTLTIEPGTTVLFEANQVFNVFGSLIANGTSTEPIIFAAKNPGETWSGLKVEGGSVEMNYVFMEDFKDFGIYTDAPTSVLIENCRLDGSELASQAPALLLWNAPSITQTVRYTTIENIPSGVGFYPYNSYVKLEYDTIRNCSNINSYIKKVSGHIHGCVFEGRTSTYAVYFNSATCNPNITCTTFSNLAPQAGTIQTTLYSAPSCSPTFAGDYGYEAYPDKTNKIEDTSQYLLTLNGTGVRPTIHINDWIQNSATGKFMKWGSPPTPAVAYDIDRQYWNVTPSTAMFNPANAAYWDWTPYMTSAWELCSPDTVGNGSITMPGGLAGGGSLDDDPTDEELLLAAMNLEASEEFEDARDGYQSLALSATERDIRWRAMLGCITSDVKCAISAAWIEQYLDSLETLDGGGYQEHLDRTRFLYNYYLNQERYEDAISECTSLLSSGLTFNDSINVAVELIGIQMAAGLIEYHGGLDGYFNASIPAPLQVSSMAEGVSREFELLATLYKPAAEEEFASRASLPTTFALYQNYPNPFNPTTQIEFDLPEAVRVSLKVFNTLGQEVAVVSDAMMPAGHHVATWDGKSSAGIDVTTGLYIYQINAGAFTDSRKMLLMR